MILDQPQRIKEYTEKGYWDNTTIDDIFKKNVEQYPDFVSLVDPVNRNTFTIGKMQRLTFKEMDEKVNQLATQQVFDEEGFFKTGDVFELVEDDGNKYYRFVERCKDIIIRGGANIAPATIEALLVDMPKIAECAIVGYPDEDLGERLALFAVPKEGQAITLEEVVTHLREKKIASYKLPERFLAIDALPRNPVGKILRRVLREKVV